MRFVILQSAARSDSGFVAGQALAASAPLPARAVALYRIWFALGWPAFGALTLVFWLMVTKAIPFA